MLVFSLAFYHHFKSSELDASNLAIVVLCRSCVTLLTVSGKEIFAVHGQKMLINGGKGRYTTGQVRDKKKVPKRL